MHPLRPVGEETFNEKPRTVIFMNKSLPSTALGFQSETVKRKFSAPLASDNLKQDPKPLIYLKISTL